MPIVPVRNLGQLGVNTDVDPFDLPPTVFNMGVNCRFEDNRISRGPVFRTRGSYGNANPRFCVSYKQLTGTPVFLVANKDGTITSWAVSGFGATPTETDVSIAAYTPSNSETAYTAAITNDVVYINRPDRVPWYRVKGGTSFATLPVWDTNWRCKSLRSIGGALVAINVTKSGTEYPTMVKTSEFTVYGATPSAWVGATNNNATENVLAECDSPLVDGLQLKDRMVLYAENETWIMEPRGDSLVWSYRRLFTNFGIVNQNCAVEDNGVHYVFGRDTIWLHDGVSKQVISDGIVRDFIYDNMARDKAHLNFVIHKPTLNEVMFCYVSTDKYAAYPIGGSVGYPGCNRAAVYNYRSKTWYFYDLPYVTSAGLSLPYTGATYPDMTLVSYDTVGGAYDSYLDTSKLSLQFVNPTVGSITAAVRSFELTNSPNSSGTIDQLVLPKVVLEKLYMDLDDLEMHLRDYKVITVIYPEGRFDPGSSGLTFYFQGTDYPNDGLSAFTNGMSFNGSDSYKLDFRSSGRYLSMRIESTDYRNFTLSGMDIDFDIIGRR